MQTMRKMTESLNSCLLGKKALSNIPRIYGIGGESLNDVWEGVKHIIETALPYCDGKYTLGDIKRALDERTMQLWVGIDNDGVCGACITEILDYPQSRRLMLSFFGGRETKALIDVQPIFNWGKEMGCSSIEIFGRPGWERFFKGTRYPFEKIHTVLRMKL